jgi:hypothetical protein
VLTNVDVREVVVSAHFLNGQLNLPVRKQGKPSSPPTDMSKHVDIQRLLIRDITCTMFDDQSHQAKWAFEQFDATRQPSGLYKVSLTSLPATATGPADGGQTITLSGLVKPDTYDVDLVLDGDLPADRARMAVVLNCMKAPVIKGIDGRIRSRRAGLRGHLDNAGQWKLGGEIDFTGFQFQGPYGDLARELNCTMKLDGRTIRITQFSANGCDGSVTADGQADIAADWKVTYKGTLDASNVDLPKLTESVAGPDSKAQRGTLSLQVRYSGIGTGIRGAGLLGLDDADVMTLSIVAEVFKQMSLGSSDQLRRSDVRAVFAFDGPLVTIEHGRLANPLSAIDVEKGGKVNVQTHQLDLYVMAVPLKVVEGVLKLPIIGTVSEPFRNLRDKLIRLHIQGDWSAPPGTIVKKEPVADVSEGTVEFFQDVGKSGGKLGAGALKAVSDVFRSLSGG